MQSYISRKYIYIALFFILILLFISIFIAVSRSGKISVDISVIPSDANVYINNKKTNSGEHYLKPGTYTISAKKSGFKDDKQIISVDRESVDVGLIPEPNSKEAYKWLKDNPELQYKREEMAGKMAALRGEYTIKESPIIESIPYTSVEGPFSIDYGADKSKGAYSIYIKISDSTPEGRVAALKWIREQGEDPTNYNIEYVDFNNPLIEGSR